MILDKITTMKRNVKFLIGAILIFTVTFGISGCASSEKTKTVKVPSVINLKIGDAEKALEKQGLMLQVVKSQPSNSVPIDCIISQNPMPGEEVKQGTIVKAVISGGSENVVVPDFTGKSFEDAVSILQSKNLNLGDISEKENDAPVGTVLSQDPAPGTVVEPGSEVKLTVSIGKFVTMPNVIGMNVNDAKKLLESQGFRVTEIDTTDIVKVSGKIVLYQYPMPGLRVRPGVEVRLRISK